MTTNNPDNILTQLSAFFYAEDLEWKVQSFNSKNKNDATKAMVVPYIQARAIMSRLDEVVGINGWKDEYTKAPEGGILCGISLKFSDEWITKWDGAENTDVESVKGGITSAFKRAAVKWGIGRFLYDVPKRWFELNERKYPIYGKDGNGDRLDDPIMPRQFLPVDADNLGRRPKAGKAPATTTKAPAPQTQAPAKTTAQVTDEKPAATAKTTDTVSAPVTSAPVSAPVEKAASKPEAAQANVVPAGEHNLSWAKKLVIPSGVGVLRVGTPFDEVMNDSVLGAYIFSYLAGAYANASGDKFAPKNEYEKALQEAALIIYESDPAKFDVGKRKAKKEKKEEA